jgi:hypothetical protein
MAAAFRCIFKARLEDQLEAELNPPRIPGG